MKPCRTEDALRSAAPRCSFIAPSAPPAIARALKCPQRHARSASPPSTASRRCCVAATPPGRSPRVLATLLALLPAPAPPAAGRGSLFPLVPRDGRECIGVVPVGVLPVACAAAPAIVCHHALPLRNQIWPRLCCSVPVLPPEGCLGVAACLLSPRRLRSTWAHPRGPVDPSGRPHCCSPPCTADVSPPLPLNFPTLSWRW